MKSNTPFLLLCFAIFTTGCDPAGPGATGKITSAITPRPEVSTLEVRACPSSAFSGTSCDGGVTGTFSVDGGLPVDYLVEQTIGITKEKDWNVVAWSPSSPPARNAQGPVAGDLFGTATFTVASCNRDSVFNKPTFCGVTSGVDIVLDRSLPQ